MEAWEEDDEERGEKEGERYDKTDLRGVLIVRVKLLMHRFGVCGACPEERLLGGGEEIPEDPGDLADAWNVSGRK